MQESGFVADVIAAVALAIGVQVLALPALAAPFDDEFAARMSELAGAKPEKMSLFFDGIENCLNGFESQNSRTPDKIPGWEAVYSQDEDVGKGRESHSIEIFKRESVVILKVSRGAEKSSDTCVVSGTPDFEFMEFGSRFVEKFSTPVRLRTKSKDGNEEGAYYADFGGKISIFNYANNGPHGFQIMIIKDPR